MFKQLFLLTALSLLAFNECSAQVYKLVDKDGKVTFSDKPPPGHEALQKNEDSPAEGVGQQQPIRIVRAGSNSRRLILETIRYQIEDSALDDAIGKKIAPRSSGLSVADFENARTLHPVCRTDDTSKLGAGFAETILNDGKSNYQKAFHHLLSEHGYKVIQDESVFSNQKIEIPEISVAALIVKAYFERCGVGRYGAKSLSFNKTDLTIEWQVFDNLRKKVIFTRSTRGSDNKLNRPSVRGGDLDSFEDAFKQAAERLLSFPEFSQVVEAGSGGANTENFANLTNVNYQYGTDDQTFVSRSQSIEQGSVTIRTPTGHGSGFLISTDGYILTNQHVVAGSKRVLVVTPNGNHYGQVIRTNARRDVALLKVDDQYLGLPLQISRRDPRIGEQIYVVGTPLSEELSFSVTRGIISGKRVMNDMPMLQTNAAINPGNSGGPVLDEYGNVVAMSVSGIFTKSGGSLNTNFVIPIEDVLEKLGLGK